MKLIDYVKRASLLLTVLGILFMVSLLLIVQLFNITDYGISFATIAASLFFIIKNYKRHHIKSVIVSYVIAGLSAFVALYLNVSLKLEGALAILLTVIFMLLLDFMHAPALGLALSIVLNDFSLGTIFVALLCIFTLFGITIVLKRILSNPSRYLIEKKPEKIKFNFRERERSSNLIFRGNNSRIY